MKKNLLMELTENELKETENDLGKNDLNTFFGVK